LKNILKVVLMSLGPVIFASEDRVAQVDTDLFQSVTVEKS
jgi:hypothetical protein